MIDKVNSYIEEVHSAVAKTAEEVEAFRLRFIGRNNVLNELFKEFKTVSNEQKRELGPALNQLKTLAQEKLTELSNGVSSGGASNLDFDPTLPEWPEQRVLFTPFLRRKVGLLKYLSDRGST